MIEPTREEWLAVRGRLMVSDHPADADAWTEAAIGPCPPPPAPREWRSGGLLVTGYHNDVWVGFQRVAHERLTPDEAEAMAGALVEHARYAREQEVASDVCGHLLEPAGRCLRPGGHIGLCRPHPLAGDDDA